MAQNPFAEGGMFREGGGEQLQALGGNPMFNIGMQLLAAGQDDRINPFHAALTGLQQAGKEGKLLEDRGRDQQLRELLKEFFANQGGGQQQGMQPQMPPGMPQMPGQQGPPGRNYGAPGMAMPGRTGPPGRDYDPTNLYRAGWERSIRPR